MLSRPHLRAGCQAEGSLRKGEVGKAGQCPARWHNKVGSRAACPLRALISCGERWGSRAQYCGSRPVRLLYLQRDRVPGPLHSLLTAGDFTARRRTHVCARTHGLILLCLSSSLSCCRAPSIVGRQEERAQHRPLVKVSMRAEQFPSRTWSSTTFVSLGLWLHLFSSKIAICSDFG